MTTAFWDASALVPLCVVTQGAVLTRRYIAQFKQVVWWGTALEIWSAVARLGRQGDLTESGRRFAEERLARLRLSWREVQPTLHVLDLAERNVDRYGLRAADALQLAAALDWCSERPKQRHFFCCDQRLGEAARQAGFVVIGI